MPLTSRVMPRLTPCSTKKVLSEVRKLGSLVRTSSRPLTRPIASETSSASSTANQTWKLNHHASSAAASPAVVTSTPADRSNSPPIISSATPTATIPMVEEA